MASDLDLPLEGVTETGYSTGLSVADLGLAGINADEAQLEPLQKSSTVQRSKAHTLSAAPIRRERRSWLPWSKEHVYYQVSKPVAQVLVTSALVFPRVGNVGGLAGVAQTQIYHFDRAAHAEFPSDYEYLDPVPTLISNAEIEDLQKLLAIPYMGDRRR